MDAGGCNATNRVVTGNRQVNRIRQSERRVAFSVLTVAPRAVLPIKHGEVTHLFRLEFNIGAGRFAGRLTTDAKRKRRDGKRPVTRSVSSWLIRFRSLSSPMPGASMPARTAKGRYCIVEIRSCRATTKPATRPKANCEAINHLQSIRACRVGFMMPSPAYKIPDQNNGARIPPSNIGRRGNIGSVMPYNKPTRADPAA